DRAQSGDESTTGVVGRTRAGPTSMNAHVREPATERRVRVLQAPRLPHRPVTRAILREQPCAESQERHRLARRGDARDQDISTRTPCDATLALLHRRWRPGAVGMEDATRPLQFDAF